MQGTFGPVKGKVYHTELEIIRKRNSLATDNCTWFEEGSNSPATDNCTWFEENRNSPATDNCTWFQENRNSPATDNCTWFQENRNSPITDNCTWFEENRNSPAAAFLLTGTTLYMAPRCVSSKDAVRIYAKDDLHHNGVFSANVVHQEVIQA
ncbi:hypothetical protein ElyMa_003377300 [Elysia marginata]|uniref:MAM domain-containing protein n=1 Tax=Elysia marginata TaxID=1093978 RepID=A0AAV4JM31_9GAST|nr:hypothetical protein ElyMa_003377300 [Elysia marginata]